MGVGAVMRRDISDEQWRSEVAALQLVVAGCGEIVSESYDAIHFGNRVLDAVYKGYRLRIVRDRGQLLTDIGDGKEWHSLENLLAFACGFAPDRTRDVVADQHIASTIAKNWDGIARALTDPRFETYETATEQAFFDRLHAQVDQNHRVAAE